MLGRYRVGRDDSTLIIRRPASQKIYLVSVEILLNKNSEKQKICFDVILNEIKHGKFTTHEDLLLVS